MSWITDAHTEWHIVNSQDSLCPLDCGRGEVYDPGYEAECAEDAERRKQEDYGYSFWVPGMLTDAEARAKVLS